MHALFEQLPLTLHGNEEATFENYYAGQNAQVVRHLRSLVEEQVKENSYIAGQSGSGCSHLLQATCRLAYERGESSIYLPLSERAAWSPDMLHGLETIPLICLDDFERIAGDTAWEEGIFHLYNRIVLNQGRLVVGAHQLPKMIGLKLPDLASRLAGGMVFQLQNLEDHEKMQMLQARALTRGMSMTQEVANYILTHCPRHMSTLIAALDVLDKTSLALKRRLTVPFVKEVLQI